MKCKILQQRGGRDSTQRHANSKIHHLNRKTKITTQADTGSKDLSPEEIKLLYSLEKLKFNPKLRLVNNTILWMEPVDVFLPTQAEYRFLKRYQPLTLLLKRRTKFSVKEIESLMLLFHKFTVATDIMLKDEFIDILANTLGMTDEYMADQIVSEILICTKMKRFITLNVWVEVFSLYLRGNMEEKMKYCFGVYDISKKGFLRREVMFKYVFFASIRRKHFQILH